MRKPRLLAQLALGVSGAVVLLVNLMPWQGIKPLPAAIAELADALSLNPGDQVSISLVQRLLVYLPLGLLAYGAFHRNDAKRPLIGDRPAFFGSLLVVGAVGLAAEILQAFVSIRHAMLVDFLLVVVIGALAAVIGEIVVGFAVRRGYAFLRLFVLGNILVLSAALLAKGGSSLESWACDYPLIIGNEATGDRPWRGKLHGIAIYPRALDDHEIYTLSSGFSSTDFKAKRNPLGAGLAMMFPEDGDFLDRDRPMRVEATEGVGALCERIKHTDAFTIEAEFASHDLDQNGPARIVTMSTSTAQRNVTLGQDGRRLSLRIRNGVNGDNGLEQQIVTADEILSGDFQHVIVRYDRGITNILVDGGELQPSLDYEMILMVDGHHGIHLAFIQGLLALIIGIAAFGRFGQVKHATLPHRRIAVTIMGALSLQLIVILSISLIGTRLPALSVLLVTAAGTSLGVVAAWRLGLDDHA